MGLRDFFYNIINKFKKNELKQLPAPQTIINNNDEVYEPEVEKNAYVNAYTNKINTKKSELKINEDGTRIKFIDSKTNKQIEVQRITKIKEKLEFNETNIDLYKAIYAIGSKEDRKLKKVYFALPTEKGILDLYKGSSKKASLKKKLKLMFSPSNLENKKVFLGVIIEDEIYNDYSLVKSNKLQEYVIELEKKRQMIKMNKEKSKEQVKKTIGKKDKVQIAKAKNKKDKLKIEKLETKNNIKEIKKKKIQKEESGIKTKDIIKNLNTIRTLNEQN